MQLRRAMEIVNTQDNNSNIFYKENPVKILSVDNNIGTAYVENFTLNLGSNLYIALIRPYLNIRFRRIYVRYILFRKY